MNGRSIDCVFPIRSVPVTGSVYTSLNEISSYTLLRTGRDYMRKITTQKCVHLFAAYMMMIIMRRSKETVPGPSEPSYFSKSAKIMPIERIRI